MQNKYFEHGTVNISHMIMTKINLDCHFSKRLFLYTGQVVASPRNTGDLYDTSHLFTNRSQRSCLKW